MTYDKIVNVKRLTLEINSSEISVALDSVVSSGTSCDITFKSALSASEVTILDLMVENHSGVPLPLKTMSVKVVEEVGVNVLPAFAAKVRDGKKLYSRTRGLKHTLAIGDNFPNFVVPYAECLFNEIEIINGELGDSVDLFILDTASGALTTIPNYPLNQFGDGVFIASDFYKRGSSYDAALFGGLQINMRYNSVTAKDIYVNYILHELKL